MKDSTQKGISGSSPLPFGGTFNFLASTVPLAGAVPHPSQHGPSALSEASEQQVLSAWRLHGYWRWDWLLWKPAPWEQASRHSRQGANLPQTRHLITFSQSPPDPQPEYPIQPEFAYCQVRTFGQTLLNGRFERRTIPDVDVSLRKQTTWTATCR